MSWVGERVVQRVGRWARTRQAPRATRGDAIVYVSETRVVVARGGAVHAAVSVDRREAAMRALQSAVRDLPRGVSIRVAAAGAWCRPFLVPEVEGARSEDLEVIAVSMVESMTGLPAQSRVWVDEAGKGSAGRIAIAADAAWLQVLEASLGRSLRSVRPWWAMAIDAIAASAQAPAKSSVPHAGLVAIEPEGLVLMVADGEAYRVAQWYELHGEDADAVLSRALVSHHLALEELTVVRWDERLFSAGAEA